jgi:RNA processing factor Prp31
MFHQVLGQKKRTGADVTRLHAQPHQGLIFQAPLLARIPAELKRKGGRLLAGKATLAARIDAHNEDASGLTICVLH